MTHPVSVQRRAALVALAVPAVLVLALLAPTIAISVGNGTGVGFAVGLTMGVTAQLVLWPVIGRWLAGLVVRMDGAFSWQRWMSQYALVIVAYVLTAFLLWVGIGFLSTGW